MKMREYMEKRAAKRSLSRKEMRQHWDRREPNTASGSELYEDDDLIEFKKGYRETMRHSRRRRADVPPKIRRASYKHFKKHGTLPALSYNWERGEYSVDKRGEPAPWSNSKKPVTVYHGGGESGIRKALKNSKNENHDLYVIPGQTKATTKGIFYAPKRENAIAYSRMQRSSDYRDYKDTPALLSTTVPRRRVLGTRSGTEAFVGQKHLRKAKHIISKVR